MQINKIMQAAAIAALYVALCLAFAPISYGPVQLRLAEALSMLAVFSPQAVVGVTLGCFIANLFTGTVLDVIIGTLGTLLAALCTRKLRHVRWRTLPVLASAPPVIFNAVLVGATLTVLYYSPSAPALVWLTNMATVGLGQIASCCVLGLLLVYAIQRRPALHRLLAEDPPPT